MKGDFYMGILDVVQIVLIVLKLCGVITWSWWAVFSPLLISLAITVLIILKEALNNWLDY